MPDTSAIIHACRPPEALDLLELVRSGAIIPTAEHPLEIDVKTADSISGIELIDPEGVSLARVPVWTPDGAVQLRSEPRWLGELSPRIFADLYLTPAATRAGTPVAAIPVLVDRPLLDDDLARYGNRALLLLVLAGPSTDPNSRTLQALRSAAASARDRPNTTAVALPVARYQAAQHPAFLNRVVTAHSADHPASVRERAESQTARGTVLFSTAGLTGSGKSTIARAVRNAVLEETEQTVTLLDSDMVRRHLSAGLGFSPADRETNIRRMGGVAAEIAPDGGLAICSPIAPYAVTRAAVRDRVTARGGWFILIHVSTPVEECVRRNRGGRYGRARRGEIADFTGVSAPYAAADDAGLILDTTEMDIQEAKDPVLHLLSAEKGQR